MKTTLRGFAPGIDSGMTSFGTGVTAGRAEADASIKAHTPAANLPERIDPSRGLEEVGWSNGRMIY
jgi:hypothetical protein